MEHIISNYHLYPLSLSSDRWKSTEWIETDGCGGWSSQASGSLCTRRYHSILLTNEIDGRYNYISQLEEFAVVNGTTYPLSSNMFPGVVHPEGYTNIEKVGVGPGFLTLYRIGSATLIRELIKEKGTPSTLLRYSWSGESPLQLHISPLFSYRGFHSLQHAGATIFPSVEKTGEGLSFNPVPGMPKTYAYYSPCEISDHYDWFYRFQYEGEKDRGLDFEEDLFSLVKFSFSIPPQKDVIVGFSTAPMYGDLRERFNSVLAKNNKRIHSFSHGKGSPQWHLARSASQCIIQTPRGNPGIVAGYHWFEEWGRDTFLSLPYFLDYFANKEEVYQIFFDFLHARKEGVIPNRFFNAKPDDLDPDAPSAEYNSVDALLWLGVAAFKVFEHFQDLSFIKEIHPLLKECAEHFKKGTLYGIQEIDDLLFAGNQDTQLSWMDAKVNGLPVTPRSGAAVEINAGWYNLKKILAYFSQLLSLDEDFRYFSLSAEQSLKAFRSTFMIREKGYLADVWDGHETDLSFRPNQLFSISLPFPLLEHHEARTLLMNVKNRLLTPQGLRTLCRTDPKYISHFRGGPEERDQAYHQGTVWPWLLIPFWEAGAKYARHDLQGDFEKQIEAFCLHLDEGCLGSVSEVFDGDEPYRYGGTASQAWSIAALSFCIKDLLKRNA